jgi:hypothetical protein
VRTAEVAEAVIFLCSEGASDIAFDGGWRVR